MITGLEVAKGPHWTPTGHQLNRSAQGRHDATIVVSYTFMSSAFQS